MPNDLPLRPDSPDCASCQDEVAEFLSNPDSYGHLVREVDRIDTHGAIVFLAGKRAYKMKRAVRYPYMDFSTLALRQWACEREIALNRRTAPELYQRAVPIVRKANGKLAFGGQGEVIEWVVVMRRFDQDALFDHMAHHGKLTRGLITALADEITRFHAEAEILGDAAAEAGGAARIGRVIEENLGEFVASPELFPAEEVSIYDAAVREALARHGDQLNRRQERGYVRQCHGDLHLRNICLLNGRPRLFDCIEFNDDIAQIDVFYDLAFLLMDLDHRDLRAFANQALNRYLQFSDELSALALLPLFLSCRAAVRAKVNASAGDLLDEIPAKEAHYREALHYFHGAFAYLVPPGPCLIAVGGLSGSGKTSLTRRLAPSVGPAPGGLHLRSDVVRKQIMGVDEVTRLPSESYRPDTHDRVYRELLERARQALAAGHAALLDAVYAKPGERQAVERLAADLCVPFVGVWLDAREETLLARVAGRVGDASDATPGVVRQQLTEDLGTLTWHRLDASLDLERLVAEARRWLPG